MLRQGTYKRIEPHETVICAESFCTPKEHPQAPYACLCAGGWQVPAGMRWGQQKGALFEATRVRASKSERQLPSANQQLLLVNRQMSPI